MSRLRVYAVQFNGSEHFILARENEVGFSAPMTAEAAAMTGCYAVQGRTLEGIAKSPNVALYASASVARSVLEALS